MSKTKKLLRLTAAAALVVAAALPLAAPAAAIPFCLVDCFERCRQAGYEGGACVTGGCICWRA